MLETDRKEIKESLENNSTVDVLVGVHLLFYLEFLLQYSERTGKVANPDEAPLVRDLIMGGVVAKALDKFKMEFLTNEEMEAIVAKANEVQNNSIQLDRRLCGEILLGGSRCARLDQDGRSVRLPVL